jgi:hypothetical protein
VISVVTSPPEVLFGIPRFESQFADHNWLKRWRGWKLTACNLLLMLTLNGSAMNAVQSRQSPTEVHESTAAQGVRTIM